MRLARELEGGERAARALLAGAGALSVLAELPANPHPSVALTGQMARLAGICALIGAVAPVRETVPLDDPRADRGGARARRRGARGLAAARASARGPAARG